MLVDALWQLWVALVWLMGELPKYATAFTVAIAIAAWLTALRGLRANQRAFEGRLLSDLMNEYASEQMTRSTKAVGKCFGDPNVKPRDVDRRRVSHYFQKIYRMRKGGFITEQLVLTAIDAVQAEFFLKMELLERAVHAERGMKKVVGDEPFEFYARLYNLPRTLS